MNGTRLWFGAAVFAVAALVACSTVAGPGLSWDEPAYRHSQVTMQAWLNELRQARSFDEIRKLFSADAIDVYFEYNRFGHNFHPPMGGYLNLLSYGLFGHFIDDIAARRMASALELAGAVTMLFVVVGRRCGRQGGLFAAASLLLMPRVMGNAHLIDTDVPLLFFWAATALAFEAGLHSRRWQWLAAICFGCLLLVKFSGVVVLAPCGLWYLLRVLVKIPVRSVFTWAVQSVLLLTPLMLYGMLFIVRPARVVRDHRIVRMTTWGLDSPTVFWICLLIPTLLVAALQWRRSRKRTNSGDPSVGLEAPWVLFAVGPLVAVALNPTWWHDPVISLASYFNLNIDRQAALPSIGIFYLGKRYFYSLPWHNAPVLMAVTIPFGTLILGAIGCWLGIRGLGRTLVGLDNAERPDAVKERLAYAGYFLLQAWTLPVFRMASTPAHDGVRLFLPTFFFWAGLAGMAAATWANRFVPGSRYKWALLWLAGPGLAAVDWVRIHPFELSYYNVGLRTAFDRGFEATYWYDCVTPRVLGELNDKLPPHLAITHTVDPLINAEVFSAMHQLGRIRNDINVEPTEKDARPWVWLSTHSSKATAFTRLLYSCKAWHETNVDGVKLFAVIDARTVDLAWALWALAVDEENSAKLGSLRINDLAFHALAVDLKRAVHLLAGSTPSADELKRESPGVRELVDHWLPDGRLHPTRARVFKDLQPSVERAIEIVTTRSADVRMVLESDGYLLPNRFGGWFEP